MGCVGEAGKVEDNGSQTEMINNSNNATPENDAMYLCLEKTKFIFRTIYKVISSHLGLVLILLAYSFIGGAIFQALESPKEMELKHDIARMKDRILSDMWNDTRIQELCGSATPSPNSTQMLLSAKTTFVQAIEDDLARFEERLRSGFYHGIKSDRDERVWDFWGSLLYSATVYTTIGYGHIAPATGWGRVATMIYALIGIPLCLVVLADLGVLFTRGLKHLWMYIRRFYYTGHCRKLRKLKRDQMRTIRHRLGVSSKHHGAETPDSHDCLDRQTSRSSTVEQVGVSVEQDVEEGEDPGESEIDPDDEFNLPPAIAFGIVFGYILAGAAMYKTWENWGFLDAFYFVFISISTIGFGDIVPAHPKFFLASSLYILVGLSLLAMMVNVIMVVVNDTVIKAKDTLVDVTQKIGINLSHQTIDDIADSQEDEEEKKENKPKRDSNKKVPLNRDSPSKEILVKTSSSEGKRNSPKPGGILKKTPPVEKTNSSKSMLENKF